MISIIVKTLDAQSKTFEVPNSTRVQDLKEKISSSVNVPVNQQRLIYRGGVLKDDFVFTQEHDGIVLHLVERQPAPTVTVTSPGAAASQTPPSTSTANTGGTSFNPAQLSQLVFQQALSGFGSLFSGNFLNRSGAPASGTAAPTAQPTNVSAPPNISHPPSANQSSTPASQPQNTPNQQSINDCISRQQFRGIDRLLNDFDQILNQLEDDSKRNSSSSNSKPNSKSNKSSSPVDPVQGELPSTSTAGGSNRNSPVPSTPINASNHVPNCPNHPSMAELGFMFTRMLKAQHRLEPYLNRIIEFFNTDPSFPSTESEEYRSTAQLLNSTLHCQHFLSEIQRLLSNVAINLSQTPPRTLNVGTRQGVASGRTSPFSGSHTQPRHNVSPQANQNPMHQGAQAHMRMPAGANQPNPPHYSIVVNAHVQPRVEIIVSQGSSENILQATNASNQTASNTQATPSSQPAFPIIPGVPQDVLSNIFQSVSGSMQQQSPGGQQATRSGRVVVTGPPGGPNQIIEEVSSAIAEAVSNAMRNQPTGSVPPNQASNTAASNTVRSSTANAPPQSSPNAATMASGGNFGVRVPPSPNQRQPPRPTFTPRQAPPPNFNAPRFVFNAPGFLQQMMRSAGPAFGTLFNVPFNRFLGSFGLDFNNLEENQGMVMQLFQVVGNELTFGEMMSIGIPGQSQPLNRIRNPVQAYLMRECFGGKRPDSKRIEEFVNVAVGDKQQYLTELFSGTKVKPRIDPVRSNMKILTHLLKKILEILFFADDATFAEEMQQHFRYAFALVLGCNQAMVEGGEQELAKLAQTCMRQLLGNDTGALRGVELMYNDMEPRGQPYVALTRSMLAFQSIDRSVINEFIVEKDDGKNKSGSSKETNI